MGRSVGLKKKYWAVALVIISLLCVSGAGTLAYGGDPEESVVRGLVVVDELRKAGFSTIQIAQEGLVDAVSRLIEDNDTSEKLFGISLI